MGGDVVRDKRVGFAVLAGVEGALMIGFGAACRFESAGERWGLATFFAVLLVAQAVFLAPLHWVPRSGGARRSLVRSVVVGAFGVALLLAGLVGLGLGLWFACGGPRAGDVLGDGGWWWLPLVAAFGAAWIATTLVLVAAVRRRPDDEHTWLVRLATGLLAGSLAEGLASIPIEAMARRRTDCTCGEGHVFAAIFAVTVGLFAFGPALLLYVVRGRARRRRSRPGIVEPSRAADGSPR